MTAGQYPLGRHTSGEDRHKGERGQRRERALDEAQQADADGLAREETDGRAGGHHDVGHPAGRLLADTPGDLVAVGDKEPAHDQGAQGGKGAADLERTQDGEPHLPGGRQGVPAGLRRGNTGGVQTLRRGLGDEAVDFIGAHTGLTEALGQRGPVEGPEQQAGVARLPVFEDQDMGGVDGHCAHAPRAQLGASRCGIGHRGELNPGPSLLGCDLRRSVGEARRHSAHHGQAMGAGSRHVVAQE